MLQNRDGGDLIYLEVKFSANGNFSIEELDKDYPYGNAWFVIVSPLKIQAMYFKTLKAGKSITPKTNYALHKIKAFDIDKDLLSEYEDYARQIFSAFKK